MISIIVAIIFSPAFILAVAGYLAYKDPDYPWTEGDKRLFNTLLYIIGVCVLVFVANQLRGAR
jgi:amino acid permease